MIFNTLAKIATYFFENRKIRKIFIKFITIFYIFFNILKIKRFSDLRRERLRDRKSLIFKMKIHTLI